MKELVEKAKGEIVRGMVFMTPEEAAMYAHDLGYNIPIMTHHIAVDEYNVDFSNLESFKIDDINIAEAISAASVGAVLEITNKDGELYNKNMVIPKSGLSECLKRQLERVDLGPGIMMGFMDSMKDKMKAIDVVGSENQISEKDEIIKIESSDLAEVFESVGIDANEGIQALIDAKVLIPVD